MASWQELDDELERWKSAGTQATFWWRDDDACVLTAQLEQLVKTADVASVPLHLAVIPERLTKETVNHLLTSPNTHILQHGYSHKDHAPKGEGSWELGDHRPIEAIMKELREGFGILETAFSSKFLPVLVPPWTRIGQTVLTALPQGGYKAFSGEGERGVNNFDVNVKVINTHCDPIKWKENARFKGDQRVLDDFVSHLARRRSGQCDRDEPTGLCTHHLAHSADLWQFLERFLTVIKGHQGARWISLETELS